MMQNVSIGNSSRTSSNAGPASALNPVWLHGPDQTASERWFKGSTEISQAFIVVFSSEELICTVKDLTEILRSTGSGMHALHTSGRQKTNAVVSEDDFPVHSIPGMVNEIRRLTGYSWDRIARILGCTRQAIYNWMTGGKISDDNREKLAQLHAVLRYIDLGLAEENRRVLDRDHEGYTLADMLAEGRFEEVRELAGRGPGRPDENWLRPRPQSVEGRDHWYERLVAQGEGDKSVEIRTAKPERIEPISLKKEE